jgi:two-component system NarL family response regulator
MPVQLLIVNDHCILSESIGFLLQNEPGIQIVGVAKDASEAIELYQHKLPDVALVAMDLSANNGMAVIKRLAAHCKGMRVIALATLVKRHMIIETMHAGAKGYIATTSSLDELLFAIKSVSHQQFYMCQAASQTLINFANKNKKPDSHLAEFNLCDREKEVLILIADGLSSKEIGLKLHIAPSTVDVHRRNIMNKIGLHKATDLTRYAIRNNLIQA